VHYTRLLAGISLVVVTTAARAQVIPSGALSPDGKRRLAKVYLRVGDAARLPFPLRGVRLLFVGAAADTFELVTDGAGDASAYVPAGDYRLVTRDLVTWEGRSYRWILPVTVGPAMRDVVLTVANAVPQPAPTTMSAGMGDAALSARGGVVPERPVITARRSIEYPPGVRWEVLEEAFGAAALMGTDLPKPHRVTALLFNRLDDWRQLDSYPANWRELPDSALVSLLQRARRMQP